MVIDDDILLKISTVLDKTVTLQKIKWLYQFNNMTCDLTYDEVAKIKESLLEQAVEEIRNAEKVEECYLCRAISSSGFKSKLGFAAITRTVRLIRKKVK